MKLHPILLLTALCVLVTLAPVYGQKNTATQDRQYNVELAGGSFIPEKNISADKISSFNKQLSKTKGQSVFVLQLESMPDEATRAQLQQYGIKLLEYISGNAFMVSSTTTLTTDLLKRFKARAIVQLTPEQKMQPALAEGKIPSRSRRVAGTVDVWISFHRSFDEAMVKEELQLKNIDIVGTEFAGYRIIATRIAENRVRELAALPFVEYVQLAPGPDELLNNKSMSNARANILRSSFPGGRNLLGEGVVIGVGDDSNPMRHIDIADRVINKAPVVAGAHGLHVIGIIAGAGIRDERYTGYATKSTVVAQTFSNILVNTPTYVRDYGMVVTNNSYGNITNDCDFFGLYDLYSRVMDQHAFQFPTLQHVFAAGNSGNYVCNGYLPGFGNVLGGYQSAKNAISVGCTNEQGILATNSSRGPVRDGRIKPELIAQGVSVAAPWPTNTYAYQTGTSMAAPAVVASISLLVERYRQLHSNANPKNGLMKALMINGATDMGIPGPDYQFGFGWLNALRSLKMMEQENYYINNVPAAGTAAHSVTIPAGIAEMKVMLYWNDSAASALASRALVNDLDLEVSGPGGTYLPQVLDTVPSQVDKPSTQGVDHINNIEQVVLKNPTPGTYTFTVKGTQIPFSNQHEYFLVYDTIPVSAILTYPFGGERFQPGDSIYLSWDAYGNPGNAFTLEYSVDNGNNWVTISNNVSATSRLYKWYIPAGVIGTQNRIRLVQNGTGLESTSGNFTVAGVPTVTLASVQCEGYIALNWTAVPSATDYEVMIYRDEEMRTVATTNALTYTISGLSKDSTYWVTVRARIAGVPCRRGVAVSRQPNTGTCAGVISDNDIKVDALLSPATGRLSTSTALTANSRVSIRIKNLDNAATTGNISVSYMVDGNPVVNEVITSPNIAALGTYIYQFSTPVDLSIAGSYGIWVAATRSGDPVSSNDTVRAVIRQLNNPPVDLTNDFIDTFEDLPELNVVGQRTIGLPGSDRYDFVTSTTFGRIRSFLNSGVAYSGEKALTLDADRYNAGGTVDSLTATYNLQGYDGAMEDIRIDFQYKHHGQLSNNANRVWVRGNDQQPWLEAYDLFANQADPGQFQKSKSIEVSDLLLANGQNFGSSFQVKWGQWGQTVAADNKSGMGYTFDDVRLYAVSNDLQMISIDTPVVSSCGLGNAVAVKITVRNSANTALASIPVKFQANGGAVITETIPAIPANSSVTYTFTGTADLSAISTHQIKTWVDFSGDSFRDNDTLLVTINNSPTITSFPYLETFESGNGNWYAGGKNVSWEYGTPASTRIRSAASGSKAWKTNLAGNYNDGELSYLYSPCFNIAGLAQPTLSLSLALDIEDCGASLCDGAYIEYSGDGKTWQRLGAMGDGTNWYNKNYSGNQLWSTLSQSHWHVATVPLPTGYTQLRLRVVMVADPYVSREGVAIDDIHIYDNVAGIYIPPAYTTVAQTKDVSGNEWVHFTDGGKLVASINANGQTLGNTEVQAFINNGIVRHFNDHYYLDRNITIKPANNLLTDSATVRFYFSDMEAESMINATVCGGCVEPESAYELGVQKYSDNNKALENGDLSDNAGTNWTYFDPSKAVKVPFDKGYYAEFKVKRFSEFWLSNGSLFATPPSAAQLVSFTAIKNGVDVATAWTMAGEMNMDTYEVQVARGNDQYNQQNFVTIATQPSQGNNAGNQSYSFNDVESNKTGVRYYRLKMTGLDGVVSYSNAIPIVFSEELTWKIYPNPSNGLFNVVFQFNAGEQVTARVFDIHGRMIREQKIIATGYVQKTDMDMSSPKFGAGFYLVELRTGSNREVFRLVKQ